MRWGGPGEVDDGRAPEVGEVDAYGDVTGGWPRASLGGGRHGGTPDDHPGADDRGTPDRGPSDDGYRGLPWSTAPVDAGEPDRRERDPWDRDRGPSDPDRSFRGSFGASSYSGWSPDDRGRSRDAYSGDPLGRPEGPPPAWPPPTALPGRGHETDPEHRHGPGADPRGVRPPGPPERRGPVAAVPPQFGPTPASPPYGQPSGGPGGARPPWPAGGAGRVGDPRPGESSPGPSTNGQGPSARPTTSAVPPGQGPGAPAATGQYGRPGNGHVGPGPLPAGPPGNGPGGSAWTANGQFDDRRGPNGRGTPGYGAPGHGGVARPGVGSSTSPERPDGSHGAASGPGPTAVQPAAEPEVEAPLLAGGIPPPAQRAGSSDSSSTSSSGPDDDGLTETTGLGPNTGRHRRGLAANGPGRGGDADSSDAAGPGPGRRARGKGATGDGTGDAKKKRKGSFWRELPLLIVVALVLTFVIQTFIARIYVIPSASMEQTLHGCTGCANDRVAVDKVTYRFTDPSPGDVVVFQGPPAWRENDEVGDEEPSSNVLVRGLQDMGSLVGFASPSEKDFVKRVIATGGQTVACCDPQNRVTVDGQPLTEPYLYYQPGLGDKQASFDPVRVPDGQLWVMGDNRNNSADSRFHGPVPVSDVIGQVRVIVLPILRWRTIPSIDPQTTTAALGPTTPLGGAPAGAVGALLAVPVVGAGRRLRRAYGTATTSGAPPRAERETPLA